jgi:spore germination protein GerM
VTTRATLVAALVAPLVVAAACGVPTDDTARISDADEVPFGLLDADHQPSTGGSPAGTTVVEVYLLAEQEAALIPVARRVEDQSLTTLLAELERGPTDSEAAVGLRSALTEAAVIVDATVAGDTATVDLAEAFSAIGGTDQQVAIAQTVLTATARPDVEQVAFTLEGRPIEIPRGDGSLTSGTVTRADYADVAALD